MIDCEKSVRENRESQIECDTLSQLQAPRQFVVLTQPHEIDYSKIETLCTNSRTPTEAVPRMGGRELSVVYIKSKSES